MLQKIRVPQFLLAFFMLCLSLTLISGKALALENSDISISSLANGMEVVVKEDTRFPLASIRLCVRAGSAWETPEEAGVSHFLEHLLFRGSKTAPKGPSAKLEQAGASINAFTGMDYTCYVTDMPAESWKVGVEGMRDYAFDPLLRPEDVNAEREVVIAEMKMYEDDLSYLVMEQLQAFIFAGTPYEQRIIGSEKTLRNLTPESIRAYMDRRYAPQEMALVVVGNVKTQEVVAYANELFGSYKNTLITQVPQPVASTYQGFSVKAKEGNYAIANLAVAFPGPGDLEGESMEAMVLAYLLAGDNTSLLVKKFRYETPMVSSITAGNFSADLSGALLLTAYLEAEKLPTFWEALLKEFATLSIDNFTDEDIARAKANIENTHLRSQEAYGHLATMLGYNVLTDRNDPLAENVLYALQRVNRQSLQNYLNTWINSSNMALSLLMPEGKAPAAGFFEQAVQDVWPPEAKISEAQTVQKGEQEVINLGNGRTVVLMPDDTIPYFSLALAYTGGERLLGAHPTKQGLAEFTNTLMAEATQARDAQALSLFLAENLASFSGMSGYNYFGFLVDGPAKNSAALLGLFREVLEKPAFAPVDIERLRGETLASLAYRQETPDGVFFTEEMPWLFPDSVYGNRITGTEETVKSFTQADIQAFWKRQASMPWSLVVTGDFNKEEIIAFASSLPEPTGTFETIPAPTWRAEKTHTFIKDSRNQAVYAMLFPAVSLLDEEYPAFAAMGAYLSGMSGPVFELGRDKESLGYVVNASGMYGSSIGFMQFFALTDPASLTRSGEVFTRIVNDLRAKPIPEAELARAKTTLTYSYHASNQTLARRAMNAVMELVYGRPLNGPQERLEKVKEVTVQDILAVAQKYLDPANAYVLMVAPSSSPEAAPRPEVTSPAETTPEKIQ